MPTTAILSAPRASRSSAQRRLVFAYGIACYAIGVSGLVVLILASFGLIPFTGGPIQLQSPAGKVLFNVGLVALFGVQHAIMARDWFKERWTRIIPKAAERSTFTMVAGALAGLIVWLWQPLPALVWSVEAPALRAALYALGACGWAYLLAATFAIDHFELFGLKQVWRNLHSDETPPPPMVERFMYRFDRHPIMTGVLFGLWSVPTLRIDGLVLALAMTIFIIIGVTIEEGDLVRKHGDGYRDYRRRVRTMVPRIVRQS